MRKIQVVNEATIFSSCYYAATVGLMDKTMKIRPAEVGKSLDPAQTLMRIVAKQLGFCLCVWWIIELVLQTAETL